MTDNGHLKIPNGQLKVLFIETKHFLMTMCVLNHNYNLIFITVIAFLSQVSLFTIISRAVQYYLVIQ